MNADPLGALVAGTGSHAGPTSGSSDGPLVGIGFVAKDVIDVSGLPLGTADGAPFGVSLVGPPGTDRSLLAAAERVGAGGGI